MPRIGKKTIERLETSLEDELHRRADAGALTAEDLQGLDAGLFAPAVYDESAAERGGYSNYSYWGSTLRIFWRNRRLFHISNHQNTNIFRNLLPLGHAIGDHIKTIIY